MGLPKLAILASGEGTNLQAILDAIRDGHIPAEVRVVLSDRKSANALNRARNAGVEAVHLPARSFPNREAYDEACVQLLREREVDWVILAGFMRILSPVFVRGFAGKILNVHPALLPAYPGLDAIERAFKAGEARTGVTVHYVDEGVDTGPMILQESTPIRPGRRSTN